MSLRPTPSLRRAGALAIIALAAALATACGAIPFTGRPARNYDFGSDQPLRIAVVDDTGDTDWAPAIDEAVRTYGAATPRLSFQRVVSDANIVITVHRYDDGHPPELRGYNFPFGAGGFATVYDAEGLACNFPPSPLPVNCSGEIAQADIYLNDIIPDGPDIDVRRNRLILHEMGHAMGLERHAPTLDVGQLAARYGWNEN